MFSEKEIEDFLKQKIENDEGFGDDEVFVFTSRKPENLLNTIKQELPNYINLDFLNDPE